MSQKELLKFLMVQKIFRKKSWGTFTLAGSMCVNAYTMLRYIIIVQIGLAK